MNAPRIIVLRVITLVIWHTVASGVDEFTALIFSTGESSTKRFCFPVLRKEVPWKVDIMAVEASAFFSYVIFLHPYLVGATKLKQLFTIKVYRVYITTDIPVNRMVE